MTDPARPSPSATERRIGRLVVPEPSGFRHEERIDWVHDIDLGELLQSPDNDDNRNPEGDR